MNANEPAYPTNFDGEYNGLTKRELFAAMVMQGYLSGSDHTRPHYDNTPDNVSNACVKYADALLKALEAKP